MLDLDHKQATLNELMNRLHSLEENLKENIYTWDKSKQSLSEIARRIQKSSYSKEQLGKAREALSQLYVSLGTTLSGFDGLFEQYKQLSHRITKESLELDYIKYLHEIHLNPSVVVFGTVEAGIRIKGPFNEISLREPKTRVRFSLDPFTSLLSEHPLED